MRCCVLKVRKVYSWSYIIVGHKNHCLERPLGEFIRRLDSSWFLSQIPKGLRGLNSLESRIKPRRNCKPLSASILAVFYQHDQVGKCWIALFLPLWMFVTDSLLLCLQKGKLYFVIKKSSLPLFDSSTPSSCFLVMLTKGNWTHLISNWISLFKSTESYEPIMLASI